jgi:hypothetical protein
VKLQHYKKKWIKFFLENENSFVIADKEINYIIFDPNSTIEIPLGIKGSLRKIEKNKLTIVQTVINKYVSFLYDLDSRSIIKKVKDYFILNEFLYKGTKQVGNLSTFSFYNKSKRNFITIENVNGWFFDYFESYIFYSLGELKSNINMINLKNLKETWSTELLFPFENENRQYSLNRNNYFRFTNQLVFICNYEPTKYSTFRRLVSINILDGKILWDEPYDNDNLVKFEGYILYKKMYTIFRRNPEFKDEIEEFDFAKTMETSKYISIKSFIAYHAFDFFWNDEKLIFYEPNNLKFVLIDIKSSTLQFEYCLERGKDVTNDCHYIQKPIYHNGRILVNTNTGDLFIFSDF